jgi:1,4-dihydroxy-2-naphthoyl-CoA hydrolase
MSKRQAFTAAELPSPEIFETTLDGTLGFELLELSADRVVGRVQVTDRVRQRTGLVHGGAYAALGELLASEATLANAGGNGVRVMGSSNHTNFLRPVTNGSVTGRGVPLHRGRTSWIWDIQMTDDQGRLCAVSRVTLAVRASEVNGPANVS